MTTFYKTASEIEAVVGDFEACRTGKEAFKHREHLTVAAWYLGNSTLAQATQKMRTGLLRFLDHHKVDPGKYHETLTVFWIEIVRQTLSETAPDSSLVERCNKVIELRQNPGLALEYYTAELLWSDEARRSWVAPDRKALAII
jgi:hypothetical protein